MSIINNNSNNVPLTVKYSIKTTFDVLLLDFELSTASMVKKIIIIIVNIYKH